MEDYDNAGKYADSCLKIYNTLIDYNDPTYIGAGTNPFSFSKNPEIIFLGRQGTSNILTGETRKGYVDSVLYKLYANSDKRKTLFFKAISGRLAFTGSYYGPSVQFDGLATDEMYLNRAEAYARKGNKTAALNDLNALLVKRFVPPYTLLTESNTPDILVKVIEERRKELCFRGIRWSDLRRLNKDPQFAKIISHGLLGTNTIFTLPPNDDKYVYPIPDNEVIISSVDQNPR